MLKKYLRPSDLARLVGLSAQQIRNYETWSVIPPARRGPQGYRQYTQVHARALLVARAAIAGVGSQCACSIMHAIHDHNLEQAILLINARHAELHRLRQEIETMLQIVRSTAHELPPGSTESETRAPRQASLKYVHEAAMAAGVRVSAVRFWEERGLLHPQRDHTNRYRLYDAEQVRRLQIIALLRRTGYDFPAIESVIQQMAIGTPEQAIQAAEQRLKEVTEESRRCVETTALLWEYHLFYEQQTSSSET